MPHPTASPARALARLVVLLAFVLAAAGSPAWSAAPRDAAVAADQHIDDDWNWPATGFRVERAYVQPADRYSPGHRGVDLALLADQSLHSPADGVVAFVGTVAARPIITIDHGAGLVTTLEPVVSTLAVGSAVARGDAVGTLASGGHAALGAVHFGVRLEGEYINPLLLLGGVPRAVLLPCC